MLKDNALILVVAGWTFFGAAIVMMGLRLYVRACIRGFLGMDDWFMLAGLALFFVEVLAGHLGAMNGVGLHMVDVNLANMSKALFYFTLWQIFYVSSTVPVKASICVALIRIALRPIYKRILWALLVVSVISTIVALMVVFTTCKPMACMWDRTIPDCKCGSLENVITLSYVVSAVNIATDWTVAIMPIFVLWDIQLKPRVKVVTCGILGMGVLSSASTATLFRLKTIPYYRNANDYLYGVAEVAIWSMPEVGLGIIAGSAATLKPLFSSLLGSSKGQSGHSYEGRSGTGRSGAGKMSYHLNSFAKYGVQTTVIENNQERMSNEDTISQKGLIDHNGQQEQNGIVVQHTLSVENRSCNSSQQQRHE
ncbi:hypothetical protein GTA08_BOTSDO09534 [Neofusicoccum parvum]|uniref:Uncharacterized protein n=1 Tax=Neofusicoccum parvum TaxID=310453 RepID=A0ACB5S3P6_9PEZI|nr:hypothetical protein GTA08_BOTSDO09534 [Neofusicoccum parvum]GME56719.1 hypothetical protein GTA08_BOTSDO09534 [Neofusicoccum parvum]